MKIEGTTYHILRMFFGFAEQRSVKKADLRDELVRRGVSPYGVKGLMEDVLYQIGHAADNRIEEIDAQIDP